MSIRLSLSACLLLTALVVPGHANGQGRGGRAGAAGSAQTGRGGTLRDVTGYWVSVVAEHWHLRMLVPPKGNFEMLPLNPEARRIANAWDPARDEASGEQCRSYGAAMIMRVPGRLHIQWADDNTLRVDIDSGTQTRLFHFGGSVPAAQAPAWQGYSVAAWEPAPRGGGAGDLKVTTTRMRPGYLRKNGVPYSEHATLEEYFDMFSEPNGDTWLVVDSVVRDPQYLTQPYVTSVAFKKIPNGSGWDPTPCRVNQPR